MAEVYPEEMPKAMVEHPPAAAARTKAETVEKTAIQGPPGGLEVVVRMPAGQAVATTVVEPEVKLALSRFPAAAAAHRLSAA
jgi:hypothetical protein